LINLRAIIVFLVIKYDDPENACMPSSSATIINVLCAKQELAETIEIHENAIEKKRSYKLTSQVKVTCVRHLPACVGGNEFSIRCSIRQRQCRLSGCHPLQSTT